MLTSDGNRFDKNARDYDIVTEAVLAVLAAKPDSPVGLLTKGWKPATAFVPNDWSFRTLTKDLTGVRYGSEKGGLQRPGGCGRRRHHRAGAALPRGPRGHHRLQGTALGADGVALTTAQGGQVTVDVIYPRVPIVQLMDQDPDATDPFLDPSALDINEGNKQIAHGIVLVLRPIDL